MAKEKKNIKEESVSVKKSSPLHVGFGNARLPFAKMKNIMVEGYFHQLKDDRTNFINGHGYIYKDMVYVWYDIAPRKSGIPYITWDDEEKKYKIHYKNLSEEMKERFNVRNIRDMSMEKMEETLSECEDLYSEEELHWMNASQTVYTPEITIDDDFLKMLVKKMLLVLNININQFTPKFPMKHTLTNMKTALKKETKTSTTVFSKWMELFEAEFTIVVKLKKPNKQMKGYVVYESANNTVRYVEPESSDNNV